MKVYFSLIAESKLVALSDYLIEKWSVKVKGRFVRKLAERINQIANQPESCPKSTEFNGLYKCVVTKQTTLYYRIKKELNEIEIITLFDTRQYPDKLKEQIK